jgi:AcrR family transcriptional regulator
MARKSGRTKGKSGPGRRPSGAAAAGGGARLRIIDAALDLAARDGWRKTSLAAIAGRAAVSLAGLRAEFSSKPAIVNGLIGLVDQQALAAGPAEGSSARDRLFDVLMRRFDALDARRAGVRAILVDLARDPLTALCHGPSLFDAMAWMLEAAGLRSSGPLGILRTKGLAVAYLYALRAWVADDSADRAKTMAALDRGLRQVEKAVNAFHGLTAGMPAPGRSKGKAKSKGKPKGKPKGKAQDKPKGKAGA